MNDPVLRRERIRRCLILWMYGVAVGHFMTGLLLPWIGDLSIFDAYHRAIEAGFWGGEAPSAARAQQVWWISLFGPTVQSLAIWMGALTRIGDRQRSASVWIWLIVGIVVWAPQDMTISLRAGAWIHVWIDSFAVVTMMPPLMWLWWHDRKHPAIAKGGPVIVKAADTLSPQGRHVSMGEGGSLEMPPEALGSIPMPPFTRRR